MQKQIKNNIFSCWLFDYKKKKLFMNKFEIFLYLRCNPNGTSGEITPPVVRNIYFYLLLK